MRRVARWILRALGWGGDFEFAWNVFLPLAFKYVLSAVVAFFVGAKDAPWWAYPVVFLVIALGVGMLQQAVLSLRRRDPDDPFDMKVHSQNGLVLWPPRASAYAKLEVTAKRKTLNVSVRVEKISVLRDGEEIRVDLREPVALPWSSSGLLGVEPAFEIDISPGDLGKVLDVAEVNRAGTALARLMTEGLCEFRDQLIRLQLFVYSNSDDGGVHRESFLLFNLAQSAGDGNLLLIYPRDQFGVKALEWSKREQISQPDPGTSEGQP